MSDGTPIAKAYVQVLPTTRGITQELENALSGANGGSQAAGNAIRQNLGGAIASVKTAMFGLPFAKLSLDAVKLGQEFDASMSNVYSLMSSAHDGTGLTADEMDRLRNTAREMGSQTQFSAKEASEAMGYMALAGWDVDQVTAALPDVLNLAASAGMGLGEASDIVTDYLSAFSNSELTAAQMSDMLAYAQANSNTTVSGLAEAYQNCAAAMNAGGQSAYTTTAMLEAMANQGYKGARAGTVLTAMQRDLTSHMKKGNITINKHNIAVQDENGNYRNMIDIMKDVESATAGMGDAQRAEALAAIFTADSIKGVNLMLNEGVDNVAGYAEALENSGGSAEKMSQIMNDNLKGDLKTLNSAFEEMKIALSDAITPAIRSAVQWLTGLLQKFNSLPGPMKNIIFGAAGLGSAFLLLKPVLSVVTALLGGLNLPLIAVGAAVGYVLSKTQLFQDILEKVKTAAAAFFDTLEAGGSGLDAFKAAMTAAFGEEAWGTIQSLISGVTGAIDLLKGAFDNAVAGLDAFFTTLMSGEGLGAAWEAMKAKFTEFDWAGLATTAKTAIEGVFSSFPEWFGGLFSNAKALVEGIDWVSVGTAIHNGIKTILDVGGSFLKTLFDAALTAVTSISWGDVGSAILGGIKQFIDAAGGFLKALFTGGRDAAASEDYSSIGDKVLSGVTGSIDTAGGFLSGLFATARDAVAAMPFGDIGQAILGGVTATIDMGGAFLSKGFEAARDAIGRIQWPDIAGAFSGLSTFMDTTGAFLSEGFQVASDAISGISWDSVGSTISSGLSAAVSTLSSIGKNVWDTITGWFSGNGGETPQSTAKDFVGDVAGGITGGSGTAKTAAEGVGADVLTALQTKLSTAEGQKIGKTITDAIKNALNNAKAALKSTADTLAKTISDAFTAYRWAETGKTIVDKIRNAINDNSGGLKTAGENGAKKIEDGFNSKNWVSLGKNIASGIASGIKQNQSVITSAAESAAQSAYKAARDRLSIGSPSRLFAEGVGKWIPAGIAKGIKDYTGLAVNAVEEMTGALLGDDDLGVSSLAGGDFSGYAADAAGGYTQNITVNSPKALSPYEVARQTRNATRGMILAVRGV